MWWLCMLRCSHMHVYRLIFQPLMINRGMFKLTSLKSWRWCESSAVCLWCMVAYPDICMVIYHVKSIHIWTSLVLHSWCIQLLGWLIRKSWLSEYGQWVLSEDYSQKQSSKVHSTFCNNASIREYGIFPTQILFTYGSGFAQASPWQAATKKIIIFHS